MCVFLLLFVLTIFSGPRPGREQVASSVFAFDVADRLKRRPLLEARGRDASKDNQKKTKITKIAKKRQAQIKQDKQKVKKKQKIKPK